MSGKFTDAIRWLCGYTRQLREGLDDAAKVARKIPRARNPLEFCRWKNDWQRASSRVTHALQKLEDVLVRLRLAATPGPQYLRAKHLCDDWCTLGRVWSCA